MSSNTEETTQRKKKYLKYTLLLWLLFLSIPGGIYVTMLAVSNEIVGELPSFEELENPNSLLATEVYSEDGKILGKYFRQNRTNVTYKQLPDHLINALVATEDERFNEHSGVDIKGVFRAVLFLGTKGGASTITQQLAKNLFHTREKNFIKRAFQKLQEWVISVRLERQYTKNEIVAMYFNTFDFINNAVGVQSAAQVYFSTSVDSLNIEQSAMLVGMAKNPALFNPVRRADTTRHRRNVVFGQMLRNGFITQQEFDSLKQLPLSLKFNRVDHKEGIAPYFREILRLKVQNLLAETNEKGEYKYHKPDGSPYNIYSDGLKVHTTINYKMQKYAEWAVQKHLAGELQKDLDHDIYKGYRKRRYPPFSNDLTVSQAEAIVNQAKRNTPMYRVLTGRECGVCGRGAKYVHETERDGVPYFLCTEDGTDHLTRKQPLDSVELIFKTPKEMTVFTWQGEKDTILSPWDSILYYKSFLHAGLMSMDPKSGHVKAWVGGIDYKHFSYDHVIQGKRQVGSTFKPFVYTLAIQNGISPCYEIPNIKYCFDLESGDKWCPQNSDEDYGYMVSLRYGLANSMNTVTAWVMKKFGPQAVINLARRMGIESHMDPVPSLCLGVADVSVYEMVGAYGAFANKGTWTEPIYITRIEDKTGNVIAEFVPETREVLSEEHAYTMLKLMEGVTGYVYNDHFKKRKAGTGIRIRFPQREYGGIDIPIAGKTGTTQNNSDGWFMGATPDLVTGVWVGADDRSVHFSTTYYGQGANTALPIWGYYMKKVLADKSLEISTEDFEQPEYGGPYNFNCQELQHTTISFDGDSGAGSGDEDFD